MDIAKQYYLFETDENNNPIWNNHVGNSTMGPDVTVVNKGSILDFAKINSKYILTNNEVDDFVHHEGRISAHYLAEVTFEESNGSYVKMHVVTNPVDITDELHHVTLSLLKEMNKEKMIFVDKDTKPFLSTLENYWNHKINTEEFMKVWDTFFIKMKQSMQPIISNTDGHPEVQRLLNGMINVSFDQEDIKISDAVVPQNVMSNKNDTTPNLKNIAGIAATYSLGILPPVAGAVFMLESFGTKTLHNILSVGVYLAIYAAVIVPVDISFGVFNNNFSYNRLLPVVAFTAVGFVLAKKGSRMFSEDLAKFLLKAKHKKVLRPLFNKLYKTHDVKYLDV